MSAILLPFHAGGTEIDWSGFEAHVARTAGAGLVPAVNMDTGYVQVLDPATRGEVLDRTAALVGDRFVAGAFVGDEPGASVDLDAYRRAVDEVATRGGLPVVFPSHGLNAGDGDAWVAAHAALGETADRFLAFELGPAFVPYGKVYDLDAYRGLLGIRSCVGAKHSSLERVPEWDRLALRDEVRPEFLVLTGNDLAIDMVVYGSDYLLGLSTMAPDAFAERDRRWATGDPAFYGLNDLLQYLGAFTFRAPVPGYRHDAAMVLAHRGWIGSDATPPGTPRRPASDLDVLRPIVAALEEALG
jgi:dihydrodipicolinate synthase/N-acetylneuraminate lyase